MDINSGESVETADQGSVETMPRRRVWVVCLMALLMGAIVFVYCGRLRRAIGWMCLLWLVAWPIAAAIVSFAPPGRSSLIGSMFVLLAVVLAQMVDALAVARAQVGQPWKLYQRWWVYLGLFIVFATWSEVVTQASRAYWLESFFIPSNGMRETLLAGDRILVDKMSFDPHTLERGQVVVFRPPDVHELVYVQRIIAVAGDTIEVKQQQVIVNGETVDEPYAYYDDNAPLAHIPSTLKFFMPDTVPDGHVFVLGDSRWSSLDSRSFGYVPTEDLIGVPRVVLGSREYSTGRPTRENPTPVESWGDTRWSRIGMAIE